MSNYYLNQNIPAFTTSRTMLQASGEIGGSRAVFFEAGGYKNQLHMPTFGGTWQNPFKGNAKFFAGDLWYIETNDKCEEPKVYLLKTYKVKSQTTTEIKIYRDGYLHVPFVGDILMKAPNEVGGTGGQAATVNKVVADVDGGDDVWVLTMSAEVAASANDILVEAKAENGTGEMLVKGINGVAPCDNDFFYAPYSGTSSRKMENAYVNYAPALGGIMYKHKMSPIPPCVEKLNKATLNGLFKVEF